MDKYTETMLNAYKAAYEIRLKFTSSRLFGQGIFETFKTRAETLYDMGIISYIEYVAIVTDAQNKLNDMP